MLLLLAALPSVFQLLLAGCFMYESPRYVLCSMKDETKAEIILKKIRGYEDVSTELDSIKMANDKDGGNAGNTIQCNSRTRQISISPLEMISLHLPAKLTPPTSTS